MEVCDKPIEIWCHILSFLVNCNDWFNVVNTCMFFKEAVYSELYGNLKRYRNSVKSTLQVYLNLCIKSQRPTYIFHLIKMPSFPFKSCSAMLYLYVKKKNDFTLLSALVNEDGFILKNKYSIGRVASMIKKDEVTLLKFICSDAFFDSNLVLDDKKILYKLFITKDIPKLKKHMNLKGFKRVFDDISRISNNIIDCAAKFESIYNLCVKFRTRFLSKRVLTCK